MRIALFADIHANLEAFQAVLAHAREQGAQRFVLLGDLVGYGADPAAVVAIAAQLVAEGAIAVRGNHDEAACHDGAVPMNPLARCAIAWTRRQLTAPQRAFLGALPLTAQEEDRLYLHADAADPARFSYITGAEAAQRSLQAANTPLTFCGHVHCPALYSLSPGEGVVASLPRPGKATPLCRQRAWLVVLGAVGQPRDGNPAACYLLFDDRARAATWHRVPYDIAKAAAKIRAAGLPEALALRLFWGR